MEQYTKSIRYKLFNSMTANGIKGDLANKMLDEVFASPTTGDSEQGDFETALKKEADTHEWGLYGRPVYEDGARWAFKYLHPRIKELESQAQEVPFDYVRASILKYFTTDMKKALVEWMLEYSDMKSDVPIGFEEALKAELNKLPYTKHVDDGQYNDGQMEGFERGARWAVGRTKAQPAGAVWVPMEQEEPKYGMLRFVRGIILNPEPGITNGETVATINQFWDVSNYRSQTKRWYCEINDNNRKVTHWMDIPALDATPPATDAIAFAEWIHENYESGINYKWFNVKSDGDRLSTSELYDLFLKSRP